jgi:hypothetical protein
MRIHWTAVAGMAVMLSTASHTQTNRLAAVAEAMGATTLNSIEYAGCGDVFSFGQAFEAGGRWPRFIQRTYSAAINYQTPAMRLIQVRSQGETKPDHADQQRRQTVEREWIPGRLGQGDHTGWNPRADV